VILYIDPACRYPKKSLLPLSAHNSVGEKESAPELATTAQSWKFLPAARPWSPPTLVSKAFTFVENGTRHRWSAILSLALPSNLGQTWVDRFLQGFMGLANAFNVSLAGGDTAQSPGGVLADIIVIGSAPKKTAIRRSGARVGDRIYVTGDLGGASAALQMLFSGRKLRARDFPKHFFPQPRLQVGEFLREKRLASAMIDISDGLSTDLSHICEESGVGAEILAEAIPRAEIGNPPREVDLSFALHGGDEYELLFTCPPGKRVPARIAGVPITRIGQITRKRRLLLVDEENVSSRLKPQGWQHFQH
jgi:thiamine-monophosphate kinase